MLIGDLEEDQAEREAAAAEKAPRTKGKPDKPRKPALRRPLPEHLPRETVLHEPVLACHCGCTDPARLTRLGEDVTEVLEKIPARLKVIRHVRPRYACRACEAMMQAPVPALPIERGRPGPGLLAHVLVSKYLTACRSTGSPASWRAKAWRSSARRWPTGSATAPGGCGRSPRRSAPTPGSGRDLDRRHAHPRPRPGARQDAHRPVLGLCLRPRDPGAAPARRRRSTATRQTARASDHGSTWPGMPAGCTPMPMPATTRSPRRRAASHSDHPRGLHGACAAGVVQGL